MNYKPDRMKETAGILIAIICVISFIGIGFTTVLIFLWTGKTIIFPSDWGAAMLSISSAALGFLLSSRGERQTQTGTGNGLLPPVIGAPMFSHKTTETMTISKDKDDDKHLP